MIDMTLATSGEENQEMQEREELRTGSEGEDNWEKSGSSNRRLKRCIRALPCRYHERK